MTFAAGSVTVAAGRVSSADYADDTVRVIVSDGCALVAGGRIERREGLTYVAS